MVTHTGGLCDTPWHHTFCTHAGYLSTHAVGRHHASLDPAAAVRWAQFCVKFVDVFQDCEFAQELLEMPVDRAVRELAAAQERATVAELEAAMADQLEPDAIALLLAEGYAGDSR